MLSNCAMIETVTALVRPIQVRYSTNELLIYVAITAKTVYPAKSELISNAYLLIK